MSLRIRSTVPESLHIQPTVSAAPESLHIHSIAPAVPESLHIQLTASTVFLCGALQRKTSLAPRGCTLP